MPCWSAKAPNTSTAKAASRMACLAPGWPTCAGSVAADKANIRKNLQAIFEYNFKHRCGSTPTAAAGIRHRRRTWPAAMHLAARPETYPAVRVFRRGVDGHRIPGGGAHDLRRASRRRPDGRESFTLALRRLARNPWNEYECGNYYARAMASYGLLIALSGFRYSRLRRRSTWSRRCLPTRSKCFSRPPPVGDDRHQGREFLFTWRKAGLQVDKLVITLDGKTTTVSPKLSVEKGKKP